MTSIQFYDRRKSHKNKLMLVLISVFVLSVVFIVPSKKTPKNQPQNFQKQITNLLPKIKGVTDSNQGTFSIYIYDLKRKDGIGINENMILTAASVNKIAILAALYYLADKNEIDLEKTLTLQPRDIQNYGTGSIRYDKPGTTYSLKTLARLMMEKSDNTAAHILANLVIGEDKIQSFINNWGLKQTNFADNKTSVFDMSVLLTKIYQGEIVSEPYQLEMLDFMDKSDSDERIPAGIPVGIKVYHKTGDEIGKIHDVAIIDLPQHPYYLGIMTSDMTDETKTKQVLAEISKTVYEYMND